jgi:hypothetical protein
MKYRPVGDTKDEVAGYKAGWKHVPANNYVNDYTYLSFFIKLAHNSKDL